MLTRCGSSPRNRLKTIPKHGSPCQIDAPKWSPVQERPRVLASGLELSLSWRPPSWTQHLQKVRPDVWDKVPASARACAQEARIPGPFVAPRCCALMPVLTWCLLTRSLRVLAGQTGTPLQVHGHAEARTRGGVPGTRACGPVSVAGHPDMCANGAFVQILRPGPRATRRGRSCPPAGRAGRVQTWDG